jgi:signal transduction histidine kinase
MPVESPLPLAAAVAFAALGANLLGMGLLILIAPRSRAVRWHAAFTFWVMAWLAMQGWLVLGLGGPTHLLAYGWIVHLLPTFFLVDTLVETHQVRTRTALLIILTGVATAGFLNPVVAGGAGIIWQVLLWGAGATLHARHRRTPESHAPATGKLVLKTALLVVVPIAVIGVILLGGAFLLYVMPLVTILIQFLIFIGVVHHRFYDIEVRAARSGEIAALAAEQERLALLGELSATLAHEIRNPLTGMRSLAQRLAGSDVDDDRRTRYAAVILGEVDRLERIVSNLLDMARRQPARDTGGATSLDDLVDDLLLLLDSRARRAGVTFERDTGGLVAAAPRDALAQALLNLLINAIAHSPAGGRVRVTARALDGGRVEVRVMDEGPGVPPAERQRIFEPFQSHGLGAGLGLAVVRRLARELDWEVDVGAADGGGASFRMRVPQGS